MAVAASVSDGDLLFFAPLLFSLTADQKKVSARRAKKGKKEDNTATMLEPEGDIFLSPTPAPPRRQRKRQAAVAELGEWTVRLRDRR